MTCHAARLLLLIVTAASAAACEASRHRPPPPATEPASREREALPHEAPPRSPTY